MGVVVVCLVVVRDDAIIISSLIHIFLTDLVNSKGRYFHGCSPDNRSWIAFGVHSPVQVRHAKRNALLGDRLLDLKPLGHSQCFRPFVPIADISHELLRICGKFTNVFLILLETANSVDEICLISRLRMLPCLLGLESSLGRCNHSFNLLTRVFRVADLLLVQLLSVARVAISPIISLSVLSRGHPLAKLA